MGAARPLLSGNCVAHIDLEGLPHLDIGFSILLKSLCNVLQISLILFFHYHNYSGSAL